jgi:hypothetical protein
MKLKPFVAEWVKCNMAYGAELVLGFKFQDFAKIAHLTSVDLQNYNFEDEYDTKEQVSNDFMQYFDALKIAHLEALKTAGFPVVSEPGSLLKAITEMGEREFVSFRLKWYFDPYEMDDSVEDGIVGIALTGRYRPTFLDWKNKHGTISGLSINQELLEMVEIARTEIVKVIPVFADAELIIKENHY